MKVLCILTGGLLNDGITNSVLQYYKYMDKSDIAIDMLQVNDKEEILNEKILGAGVSVKYIGPRNRVFMYFIKLVRLIYIEKYDIVHVHGSSRLMSIELLAAWLAGCKMRIAHSRNTTCSHPMVNKLLKPGFDFLCTERFACGEDAGKWLFGDKPFMVLHNGKNLPEYSYSAEMRLNIRKENNWQDKFVIGHVGNFNYQKNHEFLLKCFSFVADENCILVLMGKETEKGYWKKAKQLVQDLHIENQVVFMGSINNVSQVLQAMDLMLLPSFFEGLPNVVLEWQIAGLRCLISDKITRECKVSNLVEYLPIGENDEKEWAKRIIEIKKNCFEIDRQRDSEQACLGMKKNGFEITEAAKKLECIYACLAEKNS